MNYPTDIKPLTGLRFIAATWLLLYFFWPRLGFPDGLYPNIVANGNLGVDLFFILSGFVLAHVYGPQIENNNYHHGAFIWARLARVYPLHILTTLAVIAIWLLGHHLGTQFDESAFVLWHLPFHITLTHAWGFLQSDGWNFPSWSISAEWFAYLTFPVSFYFVSRFRKAPINGLIAVLGVFVAASIVLSANEIVLTDMTWQGAELRIMISFIGGAMLWQLGRNLETTAQIATIGVYVSTLWLGVSCVFTHSPLLIWPGLMALVFFLAETAKHPNNTLIGNKIWVYLGEISFAMYMVHLPVDIVYYQVVEKLIGSPGKYAAIIAIGAFVSVMLVAAATHAIFEKPIRDFMRANPPKFFRSNQNA
jgi:peptidoglycan/LPS O-acetylase OafA/YrhL